MSFGSRNTFNFTQNEANAGLQEPTAANRAHQNISSDEEKEGLIRRFTNAKASFNTAVFKAGRKGTNVTRNQNVRRAGLYLRHAIQNIQRRLPDDFSVEMQGYLEDLRNINVNVNPEGGKRKSRRRHTRRRR